MGSGYVSHCWTSALDDHLDHRVFNNVQGNLPQKIPTSTTRTTRNGRTITAYLVLTVHASRKSTRTCDNNSNASQKTKWRTSMWKRWYGECLWLWLNKLQFILETIFWRLYIQPKNQPQRTVKQLFDVTRKLVKDQNEIQGISMIDWQENSWNRTTLLTDRAVRLSTAKAYVFSDSALCMGRISENPVKAWKEKIDSFMISSVVESWIESTGSRWSSRGKISQDSQHCRFSQRSRTWWLKYNVNLSNSQDGSSSCQWREKGNEEWCTVNSQIVAECARKFAHGHWSFLGPRSEKEWYGTHT